MMSQANVEAAQRLWEHATQEAASGRVYAGAFIDPSVHPDVEYQEDPRWPGSSVYRGPEAIQARFEEYMEIFGPIDLTLREVLDGGDAVVLVFDIRGKSVPTGVPFEHEWAWVWTFRDGRVAEWRAYFEKDEALKAVGLEE